MLLTLYPNNELRARVASPVATPRRDAGAVSKLVNRAKLAILPKELYAARAEPRAKKLRAGYGGKPKGVKFSIYARRMLSRAGGVFSVRRQKRIGFFTGTLPGSTPAALEALANYSSWAVHQLMTVIPRGVGVKPSALRWQWVWEYQTRGALHWHAAIEFESPSQLRAAMRNFRNQWNSVLRGIAKRSGVDIFERSYGGSWSDRPGKWRSQAQVCKASTSQYMAKYLGKGDSKRSDAGHFAPTRWYGCSRKLLRNLKEQTKTLQLRTEPNQKQFDLSVDDLRVLSTIEKWSGKVVPFGDKYGHGVTIVFYPKKGKEKMFRSYFRHISALILRRTLKEREEKKYSSGVSPRRWYPGIEGCGGKPWLAERLWNECNPEQRNWLSSYVMGQEVDHSHMQDVEFTANYVLRVEGFLADVKAAPAPKGSLDITEISDPGKSGDVQCSLVFPDLPF